MVQPRAYIICATPRSGSTMLCDLLKGTGVAGRPHSFYREQNIADWASGWGVPAADTVSAEDFDRQYLAAARREGSSPNGVFGLRLMHSSLAGLSGRLAGLYPNAAGDAALLESAFGPIAYVHLSRHDKVAQAVSRLRAEQSGLWHRSADGSERERTGAGQDLIYDADRLAFFVNEAERDDAAWVAFFTENDLAPIQLVYETMTVAPVGDIARILTALGEDPSLAEAITVKTAKLADATNADWVQRFKSESGRG